MQRGLGARDRQRLNRLAPCGRLPELAGNSKDGATTGAACGVSSTERERIQQRTAQVQRYAELAKCFLLASALRYRSGKRGYAPVDSFDCRCNER